MELLSFKMKFGRIFVTSVMVLSTFLVGSCGGKKKDKSADPAISALQSEGKGLLAQAETLSKELADEYRIIIFDYSHKLADGSMADSRRYGSHFNWKRLKTPTERQKAKEKLAQYVSILARVIEIDAKRGVYVTHMDKIQSRYEGAIAFQMSLVQLEKIYGENKEFSGTETDRIYRAPIEP